MTMSTKETISYLTISVQLLNVEPSDEIYKLIKLAINTNVIFDEYKKKINELSETLKQIDKNNTPQEFVTLLELCNNFLTNNYKLINTEERNINEWRQEWQKQITNKNINTQNIMAASSTLIDNLYSKIMILKNLINNIEKAPKINANTSTDKIEDNLNLEEINDLTEELTRQAQKI